MARRTSDRMSAATGSSADGSVNDEGALRESWLCRSTVCANEEKDNEDDDDDNDVGACGWSPLYTPTLCNVAAKTKTGGEAHMTIGFEARAEVETNVSSNTCSRNGRRRLPLISGFSNSEALRAQLPRSIGKQSQIPRCDAISKAKGLCKINSSLEKVTYTASNPMLPSIDEVETNRRKWDLERKLEDANRSGYSVDIFDVPERKPDLRRKLQLLNPVVPSAAEVEINQQKWELERKLQDADRIGVSVDETNAPEQKPSFKRKLQTLINPSAMKMKPVVPSATEVEANRRKWDLERRLQDAKGFSGAVCKVDAPQQTRDFRRKLQSLNPFAVNPVTPSAAEVEANRRKWDHERQLQDADPINMEVTVSDAFEQKCGSAQKLPRLNLVASSVAGEKSNTKKWESKISLCNMEDRLELKLQMFESDDAGRKRAPEAFPRVSRFAMSPERHEFVMSESLAYLLLFSSTAVLHCAIFNFNLELRRFLRLDIYPFGVLLLLSWTFVGLIHFAGGVVGDLTENRVILLQRTAVIWAVAVVAFHVAAFDLSPAVSSISLVSGLLFAGLAHGVVCPNVIALGVETKLCCFETISSLSPEGQEEISSSEDDSAAESEVSYLSDVSTAVSDDQRQECDLASHKFFSGCFAARLAGSSVVQGYYLLVANVDGLTGEGSLMTITSRGFHFMLFMSFTLMVSLIFFSYQSWSYRSSCKFPGESTACENFDDQTLQYKIADLEREFTTSADAGLTWSWENFVHLFNRAFVGYALLAFVLMTLIGVGFSLVVVLLASQTSLSVRLVAFMLIVIGWLLTMIASSRQLNPTKKKLLRECRRFGLRSRQLYLAIFAAAFLCVSGCVSFLRAQLYTTLVVQVCQTRLLIPGTINTLVDPELLGTAVGASSLVLLGLARVLTKSPVSVSVDRVESSTPTKTNIFAPSTPILQKTWKRWLSMRLLPSVVSFPPVTRMCFAMLLYLISIFLSSVVELYRRKALVSPSAIPRSCGAVHSEFTFLWTSPYVVLLGASDALFRVSFQEACHDLARGSFASLPSRRWAGAIQGAISLAEALGYTTALSLVAVLSRWLFRPEPTDMALLFLLLTTGVALTHALLNRIAARAQAYQRLYFPVACHTTLPAK